MGWRSPNLDWAARKHAIAMAVKGSSFHDGWDTEISASHFVGAPPNILNTDFHYIGIGRVIKTSNGAIFTAEDFGS